MKKIFIIKHLPKNFVFGDCYFVRPNGTVIIADGKISKFYDIDSVHKSLTTDSFNDEPTLISFNKKSVKSVYGQSLFHIVNTDYFAFAVDDEANLFVKEVDIQSNQYTLLLSQFITLCEDLFDTNKAFEEIFEDIVNPDNNNELSRFEKLRAVLTGFNVAIILNCRTGKIMLQGNENIEAENME